MRRDEHQKARELAATLRAMVGAVESGQFGSLSGGMRSMLKVAEEQMLDLRIALSMSERASLSPALETHIARDNVVSFPRRESVG